MEEGEHLSKKQAQLEGNCKKLRSAAKEAAAQKSALDESLAHEQSANASTQLQLEQANAALQVCGWPVLLSCSCMTGASADSLNGHPHRVKALSLILTYALLPSDCCNHCTQ